MGDSVLQFEVRAGIGFIERGSKNGAGDAAGVERTLVSGRVDPSSKAAHDGDTPLAERRRQLARDVDTVVRRGS